MCVSKKYQHKKSFRTNIDEEYQKYIFNLSNRGQTALQLDASASSTLHGKKLDKFAEPR